MKKRGQETTRTSTIVDEYIRQLSDSGISLEGLKLLGDFEFPEEDRKLTEKELIEKVLEDENYAEQKKTIEKYITAFIKADLITQEIHRRRGFELVDKSNDKWIDGGVYLFRTKQKGAISTNLEIGSDETVKTVNGTDYVQMQYVKPEEFDELVNKKSKKLRYRYTINEDTGEIKIAQIKTIETKETNQSNIINSLFTAKSTDIVVEDIISIDYKAYIEKYTMSYEFLVNLCEVTQNPEFVYHVAQLALETNIMLVVQDDTTVEHITTVEEEKYESYENTGSSSTSGASKTSEETKIMKYETIITTLVPHLQVEYANTWSFFENYEFSKTETTEPVTTGKKVESNSIPGTLPNYHPGGLQNVESPYGGYETISTIEKWTGTFLVQKIINTETEVTVTTYNPGILKNSIEKSKQFLGLLRNSTGTCVYDCTTDEKDAEKCAKNAVFTREGINVEYGIPNSTRTEPPLNNLKSGEQMLYTLMGEGLEGKENVNAEEDNVSLYKTKMSGLIDHMKYLMTLPENEEIDFASMGLEDILTDEEYAEINIDDIIVKTDEPGALEPVSREQLIAVITATFSGQERENALSIVDTLIDCQEKYKVNAIFIVAMAHNESGIGTANTSHVKNNNWLSWNLGATYSSPQENVETVMKSIANGSIYFSQGKITIKDIGYTYCPNTSDYPTQGDGWVINVTSYVKKMYEMIGISIEQPEQVEQGQETNGAYIVNGCEYPFYKQDSGASWSENPFAGKTMKSSGCSITAIAIVLKGYGQDVTPETIRSEIGGKETNLTTILNRHGIANERPMRALTENEIISHLKSGRPIIVHVGAKSSTFWTSKQHYMVLLDYRNHNGVNQVYVSNPGTVNTAKNGWVDISLITNNMNTASILITEYPSGNKQNEAEVPTYAFKEDKVTIKIPGLSSKKKVAWVSDLHIVADYTNRGSDITSSESEIASRYNMMVTDDQTVHSEDLWPQIIDYINNNNFDAVIFGGDLMDYYSDNNFKVLSEGYKKLNSNIKKMYIRGATDDHDAWTGRTNHDSSYAISKHKSLDGNSDSKYIDLGGVRIVGLNWSADKNVNPNNAQSLINSASGSVILATHVPFESKTNSSGLEQWCRSIHNNQVYYWANNSYKWVIRK